MATTVETLEHILVFLLSWYYIGNFILENLRRLLSPK